MNLNELISVEKIHLQKLEELVRDSIAEEQLVSAKLAEIEDDPDLSLAQRWADKIAEVGGSWTFIIYFGVLLILWILVNVIYLRPPFDPYPFILLNLILSCIAALQAPVIMMSQNRQEEKDRRRSRSDFLVNLKAEMEIRGLHQKMDLLIAEQMQSLFKIQEAQIELLRKIEKEIQ